MSDRSLAGPIAKSLAFIVVTVLATTVLAASIAQTGGGPSRSYRARFTDASGLRAGDGVRIAGVQVGRVEGIDVVDRRIARVRFSVDRDRTVPASATATIKYLNLVGQRYVELARGTGGTGALAPGATIPVERTTPALDLTRLFNGFQPLFAALSPKDVNQLAGSIVQVLQGEGGTVEDLLASIGTLTSAIAGKDAVIGQVVTNLTGVLDTVNAHGAQLTGLITTLRALVSGLAADRRPIGEAISALDGLTASTAALLRDGRAPLKDDVVELGRLSASLDRDEPVVDRFLKTLPVKMAAIGRLGSYGSWMNFYLCEAAVTGATYQQVPGEQHPAPTGVPNTSPRCGR
ncbi:MCE family protein [Actinomadura parmotrematis]|uniref:MCE family protein n=1 Tax=Actinomadura parmotrematis TaxID=2864039 RepID=A0ABS7FMQ5_9ACTN|nr:MCE family protein [Actinomadura parmotrematis]MBW8481668.1 MCE family protein [Actinomadura parmotrematis]